MVKSLKLAVCPSITIETGNLISNICNLYYIISLRVHDSAPNSKNVHDTMAIAEFSCARVIEEYDALLIFAETAANKNDGIGKQVFQLLSLAETKYFLLLIRDVLSELKALNRLFQKQDVIIHKFKSEIENRLKNIISRIMNRKYVLETPAIDVNISDTSNYLRYDDFIIND